MSVIVLHEGVMAADSKAWGGRGSVSPGRKRKLHLLDDGTRVGIVSADLGEPERFLAWYRAGADPAAWTGDKPSLRALVVKPDGSAHLFDDSAWASGPIESTTFAIGSGGEYALGAIAMGASAARAVEVAISLDVHSGGPVDELQPPEVSPCPHK